MTGAAMASKTSNKPKSAAKTAAKTGAKARARKPATAKAPVSIAARASAAPGLMLALSEDMRLIPGCGFGIGQSMVFGSIDVKLPAGLDLQAIEQFLKAFTLSPLEDIPSIANMEPEVALVGHMHLWHAAIQRDANVPVFGGCRLWDRGMQNGARQIGFAVPCHSRTATMAAMQFVCQAVTAFEGAGGHADQVIAKLDKPFKAMWQVLTKRSLKGTNTLRFIDAAYRNGIERFPVLDRVWMFGHGIHCKMFNSSLSSSESHVAVGFARNKLTAIGLLRVAGLPVAESGPAENADQAAKMAQAIGYPVVVKPSNLDQGAGVTAGIEDEKDLRRAFAAAAELSDRVMVEKHHDGQDYRVTVLHGKAIKVLCRRPAGVTGDGRRTIAELVQSFNQDIRAIRAQALKKRPPLAIDDDAQALLMRRGYDADTVVAAGEFVPLRRKSNISAGGTYEVMPLERLHPDNRVLAESAAIVIGLELAGVDVISGDPEKSWRETGGIICEVNAAPQIGYVGTETIFDEILVALLGGKGHIPTHLAVLQDGIEMPADLPRLAAAANCNAAAWGTSGWIDGVGLLGPFPDVFRASKAILFDRRVRGALIAMTEQELFRCGLPAARFASIRLVGRDDWKPPRQLDQLIRDHCDRIVRQSPRAR